MTLSLVPCSIGDAQEFCAQHHRHHRAPKSALFAVACAEDDTVRGVAESTESGGGRMT